MSTADFKLKEWIRLFGKLVQRSFHQLAHLRVIQYFCLSKSHQTDTRDVKIKHNLNLSSPVSSDSFLIMCLKNKDYVGSRTSLEDNPLLLVHPPSFLVETLESPVVLQLCRCSPVQSRAKNLAKLTLSLSPTLFNFVIKNHQKSSCATVPS